MKELKSIYIFSVVSLLALIILLNSIIESQRINIGLSRVELVLKLFSIQDEYAVDFEGTNAATAIFGLDELEWHDFDGGKVANIQLLGHPRGWCPVVFVPFEVVGRFMYTYRQANGLEFQNWFENTTVIAFDASLCVSRSSSSSSGFIVLADGIKQVYLDAEIAADFEEWLPSDLILDSTAVSQSEIFFRESPDFVRSHFRFGDS